MDKDVRKIFDQVEEMMSVFNKLEARKALAPRQLFAVENAANGFRFFERMYLYELRAAFDAEYAEELKRLNRLARTGR